MPPFAIVASRQYDSSVGRYWPVRRYPWGVCEALSSEHSDVAALKKLLLELCFEEFKVLLPAALLKDAGYCCGCVTHMLGKTAVCMPNADAHLQTLLDIQHRDSCLLRALQTKTEERYYQFREEELLNLHDDDPRGGCVICHKFLSVFAWTKRIVLLLPAARK